MPILDGFGATQRIREIEQQFEAKWGSTSPRLSKRLNSRIPIFAVSASLRESQRDELMRYGLDGWILKPVDFKRLNVVMQGVLDPARRRQDMYKSGCSWESGGWLSSKMPDDPDDAPAITTPSSSATVT
jgi:DNA-binding response OmpR family regulator